VDMLWVNLNPC